MSRRGIITLPPAPGDLAVSRACARAATPRIERAVQVATWLADEKGGARRGLTFLDVCAVTQAEPRAASRSHAVPRRARRHTSSSDQTVRRLRTARPCRGSQSPPRDTAVRSGLGFVPLGPRAASRRSSRMPDAFLSASFPYSCLAVDHGARSDQDHAARALRERCRGRPRPGSRDRPYCAEKCCQKCAVTPYQLPSRETNTAPTTVYGNPVHWNRSGNARFTHHSRCDGSGQSERQQDREHPRFSFRGLRDRGRGGIDPVTVCDSLIGSRDFELPTLIDINATRAFFAKKRSTLAAAIMLTSPHPEVLLIFQGQEMLETRDFGL